MIRTSAALSVVFMLALALLFTGGAGHSSAQDSNDDRISALETQVAELEATVAALAGSDEPTTEPAQGDAGLTPVATAAAAAEAPQSGAPTGNLSGTAFEVLPPGVAGELSVVSHGVYDGMSLPLLLRNNTDTALVRVTVTVTVHDASGALLAVGDANNLTPMRVEPGGYVFGNAYFDFAAFPGEVTYDFQVSSESVDSGSFLGIYDLTIQESSYLGDRIVGTAVNTLDFTLQGPFGVEAACFGADGSLLGIVSDFAAGDAADPGAELPFQVAISSVASCDLYLIGSSGYSF